MVPDGLRDLFVANAHMERADFYEDLDVAAATYNDNFGSDDDEEKKSDCHHTEYNFYNTFTRISKKFVFRRIFSLICFLREVKE